LATRYVPDVKGDHLTPLDGRGFLLSGLGFSSLLFRLTILGHDLLPLAAAPLLILSGMLFLFLYVFQARQVQHPILRLKLLSLLTFRTSVLGGFFFCAGI